jgi:hypothetical protein
MIQLFEKLQIMLNSSVTPTEDGIFTAVSFPSELGVSLTVDEAMREHSPLAHSARRFQSLN